MAVALTVQWDVKELAAVLSGLSSPRLERAASLALNDTAKNAQVQATKELRAKIGLPARDVKKTMSIATASTGHLEAAVSSSGRPVPLIKFRAKDTKRSGVNVKIGPKTETYKRAFIARLGTGYQGVWERKTKARGPLFQLYGPSVPGMMARRDVLTVIQRTMNAQLLKNLRRQVDRQLRAKSGLAGTKAK